MTDMKSRNFMCLCFLSFWKNTVILLCKKAYPCICDSTRWKWKYFQKIMKLF